MKSVMKKLFVLMAFVACFSIVDTTTVVAAQLENVGPTGDKSNSGDLNARRYARMYNRWKNEGTETSNTQTALEQRYRAAPQTVQLAQEDPAMPSIQQCVASCYASQSAGQPQAAPRAPVQQQSLQPLYNSQFNNQQSGNGMMPPVTITGGQY